MTDVIASVAVATVRAPLPVTIRFGPWVMKHREFALCRIRTRWARGVRLRLHARRAARRDRATQHRADVRRPTIDDPAELHWRRHGATTQFSPSGSVCARCRLSTSPSGTWPRVRPGSRSRPSSAASAVPMPVTAIIGYPPSLTPAEVAARSRPTRGWLAPLQAADRATPDETRARLRAARSAMGADCWLGMDCNWVFKPAHDAIDFAASIKDVGSAGWRTLSRPGTRGWSPRSASAARSRRDGRRAGRLLPPRVDPGPRRGRRRAHRRDDLRRHHAAARHDRADRGARHPVRAAHVRARPLAGLRRPRLVRRPDRVGRSR